MRRKRRHPPEEENADRWVISYADFITLLFAFFTTLYAISHVDLGKLERFAGSMKSAFKSGTDTVHTSVIEGVRPINYPDMELERETRAEFARFGIMEGIAIIREPRGIVVSLEETLLFDGSTTELKKEAKPFLASIARIIKRSQRTIVIEGHTDNIPLQNPRYGNNIELSAARAAGAYAYLVNDELVNPDKLSASGYGEYRPVASNATPEGRARNRRVDILFVAR